jgi:hypothetical protein
VIIVMMGEENGSDIANVETTFRYTAGHSVARINHVQCPIDDQKIR